MKLIKTNIFDLIDDSNFQAICITTNGIVNNNLAVMGAGVAGIASKKWPKIKETLARVINKKGNVSYIIGIIDNENQFHQPSSKLLKQNKYNKLIFSFPTKHHFADKSDINLIKKSAEDLVKITDHLNLKNIAIPLPGCGKFTGQLNWAKDVKPIIKEILDDRFFICYLTDEEIKYE